MDCVFIFYYFENGLSSVRNCVFAESAQAQHPWKEEMRRRRCIFRTKKETIQMIALMLKLSND